MFDLGAVTCEKRHRLASEIIDEFCTSVKPLEQELERGIIHGDFNEQVERQRFLFKVFNINNCLCCYRTYL